MLKQTKQAPSQNSYDIFPGQAWKMISRNRGNKDIIIIDVSTPQEYRDLHLEGAVNVNLLSRFFKARLDRMNKTKTYVVYCKIGGRSKVAQNLMRRKFGFTNVYNIKGGTSLWKEEGLPFAVKTGNLNLWCFCPFFLSIATFRKIKKVVQNM